MEVINSFHHLPHRNFTTKFSQLNAAAVCVETAHTASPPPSFSDALSNISSLSKFNPAKARHAQIIKTPKKGDSDIKVQSLITSYLELGDFHSAAMVFFVGLEQNYLHWNSFLEEFRNKGGDPFEILEVSVELHKMGIVFGSENLAMLLKMCAKLRDSWLGLEIHVCLIKRNRSMTLFSSSGHKQNGVSKSPKFIIASSDGAAAGIKVYVRRGRGRLTEGIDAKSG